MRVKFDGSHLKQENITFFHKKVVNICIVYEINLWVFLEAYNFILGNSLFEVVKLSKNADPDKYKYSCFHLWFDASGRFSLSDGNGFGENAVIFCADMILSVNIDNKKNDILILGTDPTDGLDNTKLTAEKEYSIKLLINRRNFVSVCIIMD